jgi:cytochrome c peroxidase
MKRLSSKPLLGGLLLFLISCSAGNETPSDAFVFKAPEGFPSATYTFDNNPLTKEGFELGRKLFFDPMLSRDGSVSCNNCHIQATAFSDSQQHPLSVGVDDRRGIRNAPPLFNLAFMNEFFWDGGVTHLDFVPTNAIEADFEMDETLANVVRKLNKDAEYPGLFKSAFGADSVSSPYLLHALSQFLIMMVSANSRYDKFIRNEGGVLTTEELEGMAVFENKCSSCHAGVLFSDFSYRNNGISSEFTDEGRARITESEEDLGKFRVPTLRNIALTAPYMHNAKFKTLEEVLDHYTGAVHNTPTLDPAFTQNGRLGLEISDDEKKKIIAFLRTLTDREFVSDERFHNPN